MQGMGYPNAEAGSIMYKGGPLKSGEGGKTASGSGEEENSQRYEQIGGCCRFGTSFL